MGFYLCRITFGFGTNNTAAKSSVVVQRTTLDSVLAKYNMDFPFHPAVLKLGLKYADGTIKGANARCIAMLDMLREMVEDYSTPSGMHPPPTLPPPVFCTLS